MRLITNSGAPVGRPEVVCPVDGATIHWDEAGVTCLVCGRAWEREGDIPLFLAPDGPETDPEPIDEPLAARNDWRFRLSIDEGTRVLELGARGDGAAVSLAYEAESVVALRASVADAIRLEKRRNELELSTLAPMAAPPGIVPVTNGSIDVAVIHDVLSEIAADEKTPERPQRQLLHTLSRKVAPGGLVWAHMRNRFAWNRRGWDWARTDGSHGLDAIRQLFQGNGFPRVEILAVLNLNGRREIIPLDDPTLFEFVTQVRSGSSPRDTARRWAARAAFRYGAVGRLAPSYIVIAYRGKT